MLLSRYLLIEVNSNNHPIWKLAMKTEFIMVPDYVARAFRKNNTPFTDILNFKAVSKILSTNDVVHLLSFQKTWDLLLKDFTGCTGGDCDYPVLRAVWDVTTEDSEDLRDQLNSVYSLEGRLEQVERDNADWYFTNKYQVSETPDVDLVDIGNIHRDHGHATAANTVVCIAEKGCFATSDLRSAFITKCVKRAYGYEDLSDIAQSDLFFAFLRCLKKQ